MFLALKLYTFHSVNILIVIGQIHKLVFVLVSQWFHLHYHFAIAQKSCYTVQINLTTLHIEKTEVLGENTRDKKVI